MHLGNTLMNLPQDLEPRLAEEGRLDSFLCSKVCHCLLNSCPEKSKSGVIDHKQLKVMHTSPDYNVVPYA